MIGGTEGVGQPDVAGVQGPDVPAQPEGVAVRAPIPPDEARNILQRLGARMKEGATDAKDAAVEKVGDVTGEILSRAMVIGLKATIGEAAMKDLDSNFKAILAGAAAGVGLGPTFDEIGHTSPTAEQPPTPIAPVAPPTEPAA